MTSFTKHAAVRAQQRAVPPLICEWLFEYGASVHDNRGATILYFDKKSKKQLTKAVGRAVVNRLNDLLNCYLVEIDGRVITTGRRFKRVRDR